MATYAADTKVTSETSRAEIERTITRYGAEQFAYMVGTDQAMIAFVLGGMQIRLSMAMPSRTDRSITHYKHSSGNSWVERTKSAQADLYEKAVRQRWRALALVVKAKLEAIEAGISTLEQEFFSNLVLPGGRTVFETAMPQIEVALAEGTEFRLQIGTATDHRGVG